MRNYTEIEAVEGIVEDIISNWANHKLSYDYLTEVRMIDLGDSTEFTGIKGSLNLYTQTKGINVNSTISSDLSTLDKGVAIGSSFINAIEKNIEEQINASNLSGKLSNMKGVVKIVIDNSVLVTQDNIACLKYGVAVIY